MFNKAQLLDGRAKDLEQQAGGPIVNPAEMASPRTACSRAAARALRAIAMRLPKHFPGEPDPITLGNVQKAIAVFEATLITPDAAFDRFLKGDTNALSPAQKEGLTRLH